MDEDGDDIYDRFETSKFGTNPRKKDSDDDGLSDGKEVFIHETDPLTADSDGDGVSDGEEVAQGTDPLVADGAPA